MLRAASWSAARSKFWFNHEVISIAPKLEASMQRVARASGLAATHDDVKSILGELDETKMLPILALRPTVADLEAVSVWLGGDADVFGSAEPLKGVASQIVTILTADEEEEPPPAG
jgi:hypothetical protein